MDCFYRRRLPHWYPEDAAVFVTWRLAGSPPPSEPDILTAENTGRVSMNKPDQDIAQYRRGPAWLGDPRVAEVRGSDARGRLSVADSYASGIKI